MGTVTRPGPGGRLMPATDWLADERAELAADRILDAAAAVFASGGFAAASMADIADRAGCSRATLYRTFSSRHELRRAFVNRETLRIMASVELGDPRSTSLADRLIDGLLDALRRVRADPVLAAWFTRGDLGIAAELSAQDEILDAIAGGMLATAGVTDRSDGRRRARWLVRSVTSFLVLPEADPDEERRLLADFVVPAVLAPLPADR